MAKENSPTEIAFFESKVRPILVENCYECHSVVEGKQKGGLLLDRKAGWVTGGDSGQSALNLENPPESLLIKMIRHDPDFEAMPPKSKLSNSQIKTIEEWVSTGAPDPRDEALGEALKKDEFDLEKRKKWWSLQALRNISPPEVQNMDWPITDYDKFILAKLEEKEWSPAQPAGRSTLLRRASYLLTGLAPTEDEMKSFHADKSEDAFEKQVDRLLDSPHFGERFARHWMDVVRYADSKAFEQDYTIPYGDEYRDYLIRAFNHDVPFDQFLREAFAGDLLAKPRIEDGVNESVIGPGFFLFSDGHHGPPDLHEDEARVIDGMINTASVAYMGLTVSCAKCHDHKFDAITAGDYYSLYGILRSSRIHYSDIQDRPETDQKSVIDLVRNHSVNLADDTLDLISEITPSLSKAIEIISNPDVQATKEELKKKNSNDRRSALKKLVPEDNDELVLNWLEFLISGSSSPELRGLHRTLTATPPTGFKSEPVTQSKNYQWTADGPGFQRIDSPVFLSDPNDPSKIRGGLSSGYLGGLSGGELPGALRSQDFVLDGKPIELWVAGLNLTVNLIIRNYELTGHGPTTAVLRKEVNGGHLQKLSFPTVLWPGETAYLEVIQHGRQRRCLPAGQRPGKADPNSFALIPDQIDLAAWDTFWTESSPNAISEKIRILVEQLYSGEISETDQLLLSSLYRLNLIPSSKTEKTTPDQKDTIIPRYVRSLTDGPGLAQPIYIRGNHKTPSKDPNPRRFLDGFGGGKISSTGSGRLEYANRLLTDSEALVARVRVNRLWSRIFGQGIVESVDDFGKMGSLPSHPDLLDFMAARFINSGYSTKSLLRELVTSQTFRMSSRPGYGVLEIDPKNSLLQHMPLRRMDAEGIRDHILSLSGGLDRTLYGPTIPSYLKDIPKARGMPATGPLDGKGRRTIYQEIRRNFLPSFRKAFNFPNPSEPVGRRQTTNVPAQALTLLNHPFVLQQSKAWAERLLAEENDDESRIRRLHLQSFSREPSATETKWTGETLSQLLDAHSGSELEAWTSLCHLIMNRKETIYVF